MMTLTYPWFLLGLGFLAVPVILHLMNREVPRRVVFPSIRFIPRARLPREGRRRLRDLILLLIRLTALAAAILAFARPLWRRDVPALEGALAPGATTVIVLDASASMSAGQLWERARAQAQAVIEDADGPVGLIVSSRGTPTVVPPTTAAAPLREALAAAAPRPVAGDHSEALLEAARLLADRSFGRVVLISDLQLGDWQGMRAILPAGIDIGVRRPDVPPIHNVGIADVSVSNLGLGRSRVVVQVRSVATIPQQRSLTVRIGNAARTVAVSLPPLQVRNVAMALEHGSEARGIAELTRDDYAWDDTFHFWAGARPPVHALAVSPDADPDEQHSAQVFFVRKSLEANAPGRDRFRVESVPADAFFALDLENVPIVFLLGAVEALSEAGFEQLHTFLEKGGSLVCTPGRMPSHMLHSLHVNGLFRGRFIEVADRQRRRGETFGVGWVNPEGLLGPVFSRPEETDLFLFPIRRYVRFEPGEEATVLLRTLRDDPLLVDHAVARGRVFLSALAFDTDWSDLPLTSSFLPIVRRIAQASVPAGHGVITLSCGMPIPARTDLLGHAATRPDDDAPTDAPGVLVWGETPIQINVDRRESSPETVNTYDLIRQLTGTAPSLQQRTTPPASITEIALWPYLAVAAAVVLLLEKFVTHWTDAREIQGRMPVASR